MYCVRVGQSSYWHRSLQRLLLLVLPLLLLLVLPLLLLLVLLLVLPLLLLLVLPLLLRRLPWRSLIGRRL
jgi:hypothetical protein